MNTQEIHEKIIGFQNDANAYLESEGKREHRFVYGGRFISGHQASECETLILSFNPGFSAEDDWEGRESQCKYAKHVDTDIKYIAEFDNGGRLATEIVNTIFGGDKSKLNGCAETYVFSPFASPKEVQIRNSLKSVNQSLRDRHHDLRVQMVMDAINSLRPKNILIIGLTTFDEMANDPIKSTLSIDPTGTEGWIKGRSGRGDLLGIFKGPNGLNILACKHLSGSRISKEDRNTIQEHASKLF